MSEERRSRLTALLSFEEIATEISRTAEVIAFEWESYRGERLRGCNRAAFLLHVSEDIYDAFFNSPVGYRAQYAINQKRGEEANRSLIGMIQGKLLSYANEHSDVALDLVRASLDATDAKSWIREQQVHDQLGDDFAEIRFERWIQESEDGVGLRAPLGTQIEVNGGWFDAGGREHRDPRKASRSYEIYTTGFT